MGIHIIPLPTKLIPRKKNVVFDEETETSTTETTASEGIPQGIQKNYIPDILCR
jgi:hypothetical protein